ncbi:MAG: hypothetical protein RXP28_03955 [Nitrososphaeria archaeon]
MSKSELPKQQAKKCLVCGSYSEEGLLCFKHRTAAKSLTEGYKYWKEAFNISFNEYLKEVRKRSETGTWVKEIIDYVIASNDFNILLENGYL